MIGTPETCAGTADGTIIAIPLDTLNILPFPWDYQWIGPGGNIIQTTIDQMGPDTITGLAPGTYMVAN